MSPHFFITGRGGFTYLRRLCYLPKDTIKMLITGDTQEKIERTILFDHQTGQTQEVTTADDEPVYKSCLLDGEIIHTKQTGTDLDDRIRTISSGDQRGVVRVSPTASKLIPDFLIRAFSLSTSSITIGAGSP